MEAAERLTYNCKNGCTSNEILIWNVTLAQFSRDWRQGERERESEYVCRDRVLVVKSSCQLSHWELLCIALECQSEHELIYSIGCVCGFSPKMFFFDDKILFNRSIMAISLWSLRFVYVTCTHVILSWSLKSKSFVQTMNQNHYTYKVIKAVANYCKFRNAKRTKIKKRLSIYGDLTISRWAACKKTEATSAITSNKQSDSQVFSEFIRAT